MEILRVENLSKVYGSGAAQVKAVDGISFSVKKGELDVYKRQGYTRPAVSTMPKPIIPSSTPVGTRSSFAVK